MVVSGMFRVLLLVCILYGLLERFGWPCLPCFFMWCGWRLGMLGVGRLDRYGEYAGGGGGSAWLEWKGERRWVGGGFGGWLPPLILHLGSKKV